MTVQLVTTAYATELRERMARSHRDRELTSQERDKRTGLAQFLRNYTVKIEEGAVAPWRELYQEMLPLWREEVHHESNSSLSHWGGSTLDDAFYARGGRDLFRSFDEFMRATRNADPEDVDRWITRIDSAIERYKSHTFFTYESFYKSTFPLEDLDFFIEKERYYPSAVIAAFNAGYTPELIRKTHHTVWGICSPEFVAEFIKSNKPAVLNSLTQLGSRGSTRLTEEIVADLVEAGYQTQAEVKDYARAFGIGWTEDAFFSRTAAAKRKYPQLAEYTPEV